MFSTASVDPFTCYQVGPALICESGSSLRCQLWGSRENANWAHEVCFWFFGQRQQWPVPGLFCRALGGVTLFLHEQRSSYGSCWWAKVLSSFLRKCSWWPSWRRWTTCETSAGSRCPLSPAVVTLTLAKRQTSDDSQKDQVETVWRTIKPSALVSLWLLRCIWFYYLTNESS